jgi:lysosomal acid lipase/cholesteryl ester hydrolase
MAYIPFVGRLFFNEYLALVGAFFFIGLEGLIRIITLLLPERIIRWLYLQSRTIFNTLSSTPSKRTQSHQKNVATPIAQAHDFVDLCELYGYYAEEHVVQTEDGYLLGLHRLARKPGEEDKHVNAGEGSLQKKVVYLHHGLMMNSEVWVCLTDKERCLPFVLVEQGYDVWLGNNRGNKYSKKSVRHSPTSNDFWNFSIDQFAFHDIPDTIGYILNTTKQESLSYIGFSQGTAQAFATLSIHPSLNEKIDVFIALAPAMSPPGLANGIVASFVKASPEILFLAFGRRSLLSSAGMWQALLYPPIFVRFIDISLSFLFGWRTANITPNQKLAAYPHLYSFSSTKSVVHWFQIIRNGTFQMYDDEVQSPFTMSAGSRYYKVAKFPTRNIRTPIVLVYGGSDSLVDIEVMMKELPAHTVAQEVPHYEHLDFLWASDVDKTVFPSVFEALELHARGGEQKERGYSRQFSIAGTNPFRPKRASLANLNHFESYYGNEASAMRSILKKPDSTNHLRTTSVNGDMTGTINEEPVNGTHAD